MVPPQDNGTINKQSRSHYESFTPGQALIEILRKHEEIIHDLVKNQMDVNAFGDEPALGTITVQNPSRTPILITDLYANWSNIAPTDLVLANAPGGVTAPAANANLSGGINLLQGVTYEITSVGYLDGTIVPATDDDNFQLVVSSGNVNKGFLVPGVAGQQGSLSMLFTPLVPGLQASTRTINAGSAAAVYHGSIKATVVSGSATLLVGQRTFQLPWAQGQYSAVGGHGLQLDNTAGKNQATLTIVPPVACHLEFAGYADIRKVERP